MSDIQQLLASFDWNFPQSSSRNGIHNIHPYPARFIPEIPRALIALFHPGDDSLVLDPFCGSGTTLVESAAKGISAYGIELSPLAALISKVKTTPLQVSLGSLAREVEAIAKQCSATIPSIPRLDHWFARAVQMNLAKLVSSIDHITDPDARDALKVCLSRIIIRVSRQESDTRYAAVEKNVDPKSVYSLFVESADLLETALSKSYGGLFPRKPDCLVISHNVLSLSPSALPRRVGLVVTSPPYPNAYEYWLYHKYRMYWLGMDPLAVRAQEIGARPHYFKKNHQTEHDFEEQMTRVFLLLSRVMTAGSLACFLLADSIIHGRKVDNGAILRRSAELCGFHEVGAALRSIPSHRKSFNPSHARINQERIAIFQLSPR
jgi:site-specific DNA-methyltransferase (cytosine-N4-specific)